MNGAKITRQKRIKIYKAAEHILKPVFIFNTLILEFKRLQRVFLEKNAQNRKGLI